MAAYETTDYIEAQKRGSKIISKTTSKESFVLQVLVAKALKMTTDEFTQKKQGNKTRKKNA